MSDKTTTSANALVAADESSPHDVVAVQAVANNETTTITTPPRVVEVCQGSDCYGLGGGAALLEIEELCREFRYNKNENGTSAPDVVVRRGGCRNYCSMGPNVHCQGKHFAKVKTIQDCASVTDHIFSPSVTTNSEADRKIKNDLSSTIVSSPISPSSGSSMIQRMRKQRAERERWTFLRNVAAAQKCKDGKRVKSLRQELSENMVFASNDGRTTKNDALSERIFRRRQRYEELITNILIHQDDDASSQSSSNMDNDDDDSDCKKGISA